MLVSCFCGNTWQDDEDLAICPVCRAITTLPRITDLEAQEMEDSLERLLRHHPSGRRIA